MQRIIIKSISWLNFCPLCIINLVNINHFVFFKDSYCTVLSYNKPLTLTIELYSFKKNYPFVFIKY